MSFWDNVKKFAQPYSDEDYDDYEAFSSRKIPMRVNCETPRAFSRIMGGLLCSVNALTILFTVYSLFIFLAGATSLREGAFADLFTLSIVLKFERFALNGGGVIIGRRRKEFCAQWRRR